MAGVSGLDSASALGSGHGSATVFGYLTPTSAGAVGHVEARLSSVVSLYAQGKVGYDRVLEAWAAEAVAGVMAQW
jgi:hypothetical protein